jgi:hypothetical protein
LLKKNSFLIIFREKNVIFISFWGEKGLNIIGFGQFFFELFLAIKIHFNYATNFNATQFGTPLL